MTTYRCDFAWLGGDALTPDVDLRVEDGLITAVTAAPGAARPTGATRLRGAVVPGFVDGHSHAFHRALRGRTHAAAGDFWSWRDAMYAVAGGLDPDGYRDLATAVYAEAVLAGVTHVCEFHYLHHPTAGGRYVEPNAMGLAVVDGARAAGVRLTLLDTCYLHAGFDDAALSPVQQRFSDGDADTWAARASALVTTVGLPTDGLTVGAAIHSVRAVGERDMATVAAWAAVGGHPLHMHVSEQPAENRACLAATGRTPARLAADAGALGPRAVAVHATHVTADDIELLAAAAAGVCLCPTTERDLADGIGPAAELAAAGVRLTFGADSRAVVDPFEEARAVELDERLRSGRRGTFGPAELLEAGTGRVGLAVGGAADLVAVRLDAPRLAGFTPEDGVAHVVFSGTAADVGDVLVAGHPVVTDGVHTAVEDVAGALRRVLDLQG